MDLQRLIARLEAFYTPDQREFFHQTEQRGGGGKGRSGNTAVRRHRTYFHFYFNATEEMFQLLMKSNWITLPYSRYATKPEGADRWCDYCRSPSHGTKYCFILQDLIHATVQEGLIRPIRRGDNSGIKEGEPSGTRNPAVTHVVSDLFPTLKEAYPVEGREERRKKRVKQ